MAFNRLLKNACLLRFPHPSPFNVPASTPHGLGISGALHPDVFEQPESAAFSAGRRIGHF
jgi:hypothetical protein